MSDNINVKATSNLYTDPARWGVWLCVGCLAGIADGNFMVFGGPCCRFPVFTTATNTLRKGMNSTDEAGRVHELRRCAGCLITGKACVAPPDELEDDLQAIADQLTIIYDPARSADHGDAKFQAVQLAKLLRTRLDRAPYVPHSAHLRLHNGSTDEEKTPRSAVHPRDSSKSKASLRARDESSKRYTDALVAERLENLMSSPSGRGSKRKFDDAEAIEMLSKAREEETAAKNAHRDHLASARPSAAKTGKAWDTKKNKLAKAVADARSKVQGLEAHV